jgi:hypothetical protein
MVSVVMGRVWCVALFIVGGVSLGVGSIAASPAERLFPHRRPTGESCRSARPTGAFCAVIGL